MILVLESVEREEVGVESGSEVHVYMQAAPWAITEVLMSPLARKEIEGGSIFTC